MIWPGWQKPHCGDLLVDPGLLNRVQRVAVGEALDRRDGAASCIRSRA